MTLKKALYWQFAALIASLLASAYMAARLADRVPIHWNIHGQADGWGSKWTNFLMMPGILLAIIAMTVALPRLSPKGYKIESFGETYAYVMALLGALFLALHIVILQASTPSGLDVSRTLVGVLMLFFALLGNVMGRIKRNYYVGIRTPWTLADDDVWRETHRAAGKLWLVGGMVGAVAAFLGAPGVLTFGLILVLAVVPIGHSYLLSKRKEA